MNDKKLNGNVETVELLTAEEALRGINELLQDERQRVTMAAPTSLILLASNWIHWQRNRGYTLQEILAATKQVDKGVKEGVQLLTTTIIITFCEGGMEK